MGEEFKKYDSEDRYTCAGVRLTEDATVRDGANGKMVRLKFVSNSRTEGDSDLWIEANIADRQADVAAFLKKGDTLHSVEGKPCLRRWGDSQEKFSFNLRRAAIVIPIPLWKDIKERGFTPGASKPADKSSRFGGKSAPPKTRKPDPMDDDGDIPF